jgi:choline dehydrogenase-like flavoprotein
LRARQPPSADPSVRVLLLEAGGKDRSPNIKIPAAFSKQFHTKLDWDFATEPEPFVDGRSLYVPRGKGLGCSSSMNAMLYVRGRPLDYDSWEAQGAPGWGYRDVLPYFLKSEDNVRGASEWHNVGGPLRVSEQRSPRPLDRRLIAASEAAGIPWTPDYNGPEQDGVSMFQVNQWRGRRFSSADAFLAPAAKRANLTIRTKTTVAGIEFEGSRAVGVRVAGRGRSDVELIRAEREVVLSAGAIGSPHLLQLSGIGAPDDLRAAGVSVRHALAGVGRNLQDHPFVGAETYDGHAIAIAPVLVAPRARGRVWLRNSDPAAKPRILTNSLSEPEDVASLVAGVRLARRIAEQPGLAEIITEELKPGPEVAADSDLEADLRRRLMLIYHPVGTCRMSDSAQDAVVDSRLRVHGLERLRVVDASIMPLIPGGNDPRR